MRILYITDFYYTISSGAKTSATAHLYTLKKLYGPSNVSVVALVGQNEPEQPDKGHIIVKGITDKFMLFVNCCLGYSTYLNRRGIKQILTVIGQQKVDVVFIDNSIFGILVKKIKKTYPSILVLAYYHDVKAKLAYEWKKNVPFYRKPIMTAMIRNEKLTAKYADVNFVLGNREEKLFIQAYGKKPEAHLSVYMNTQLSASFFNKKKNRRKKILFFGGYYKPNVHGIQWFVDTVFPDLIAYYDLIIAGRGMEKLETSISAANIKVYGFVENIEQLYRDADIIISPIFEGGGMKVKIAEAMSYGKLIIGTNESYEGYWEKIPDEYWDKFFFMANTKEDFLEKLLLVLSNSENMFHYNKEIRDIYNSGFSEEYAEFVIKNVIDKRMNMR